MQYYDCIYQTTKIYERCILSKKNFCLFVRDDRAVLIGFGVPNTFNTWFVSLFFPIQVAVVYNNNETKELEHVATMKCKVMIDAIVV